MLFLLSNLGHAPNIASDSDLVLNQARALDEIPHEQRGRLHGVAVAIKDIMDTQGILGSPV